MEFRMAVVEAPGNPNCRTFQADDHVLSAYGKGRLFAFRVPLGKTEPVLRDLNLIGPQGRALVGAVSAIAGVDEIFLSYREITVVLRRNGVISWGTVSPQISSAFTQVFGETTAILPTHGSAL